MLLIVPHNIGAVCDYMIDMDGNAIIQIKTIVWSGDGVQKAYGTVTIGGVKYVSSEVGQGMSDGYQKCTSSNGKNYYVLSHSESQSACPTGTTLQALPGTGTGVTPNVQEVHGAIGMVAYHPNDGCRNWQNVLMGTDLRTMRYHDQTPSSTDVWTSFNPSGLHKGFPLCKLDYQ